MEGGGKVTTHKTLISEIRAVIVSYSSRTEIKRHMRRMWGLTAKEAADLLDATPKTVDAVVQRIFETPDGKNRVRELVGA